MSTCWNICMLTTTLACLIVEKNICAEEINIPADLIVVPYKLEDNGLTNPRYTPDAAANVAVRWASVRQRVTVLVHSATIADMQARLKSCKDRFEAELVENEAPSDELKLILEGIANIKVVPFSNGYDVREKIDNWEKNAIFTEPRACLSIVHFLGHGKITDNGDQGLIIPTAGGGYDILNLTKVVDSWSQRSLPFKIYVDACREWTDEKAIDTAKVTVAKPLLLDVGAENADFVVRARAQQLCFESDDLGATSAHVVARGYEAMDCPDLLANWVADAIKIHFSKEDKAHFIKFGEKSKTLTAGEIWEHAKAKIMRPESKQLVLDDKTQQWVKSEPKIKFGILHRQHVIATTDKTLLYRSPFVSAFSRWKNSLVFKNNEEIAAAEDKETGAMKLTHKGLPKTTASYLYAIQTAENQLNLRDLLAPQGNLVIKVAATAASDDASKPPQTLHFLIQLQKGKSFTVNQQCDVKVGESKLIVVSDIPASSETLGISAIPHLSMPVAKSWPKGASLHILSMDFAGANEKLLTTPLALENVTRLLYLRDLLISNPLSRVVRNSPPDEVKPEFDITCVTTNGKKSLAGVGGPIYAVHGVEKGDELHLQLSGAPNYSNKLVNICILDGTQKVLDGTAAIGKSTVLKFDAPGKHLYFAITAAESCKFSIDMCKLKVNPRQP